MKPLHITVVIPTFNEEKYIRRCLTAFSKQKTSYGFDVLLVDHDSKDDTRKIAKLFPAKIIRENRRGTAVARQTGTRAAKGEIVAYTEADCVVPVDWIEKIGRHFSAHPDHVGLTGRYVFDDATPVSRWYTLFHMDIGNRLYHLMRHHFPFRGTDSAGRKSIILKAGGFREDGAPFDDADCSSRVARYGYIHYDRSLIVETSSRRVKGRFLAYAAEFLTSSFRLFVLGHKGDIRWYKVIR